MIRAKWKAREGSLIKDDNTSEFRDVPYEAGTSSIEDGLKFKLTFVIYVEGETSLPFCHWVRVLSGSVLNLLFNNCPFERVDKQIIIIIV